MSNHQLKNYISLHTIVFVWGFTAILGKLISLGSLHLVFFRMWIAVGILLAYLFYKKSELNITQQTFFKYVLGGTIIAFHWVTFYKAIKVSNVSLTVVTLSTGTFFTALLEPVFFKRKINISEVIFGLLIVVSLYLINFYGESFDVNSSQLQGFLYALVSAFLSALFSVFNGKLIRKHSGVKTSFYQLLFGAVVISGVILFSEGFTTDFFKLSNSDWVFLFLLGSVCTAWTFTSSINIMKHFTPYTVMLTINLEPIYSILLALIIFKENEKMSLGFYIGALVILSVIALNGILKHRQKKKAKKLQNTNQIA